MEAGGDGVISVIANAVPKQARDLTDAMLAGNAEKAEEVSPMLYQLAAFAFIDGNPVSIKYIMKSMGLIKHDCCRLPLGPMASDKSVTLEKFLEKFLKSEKAR
jgi:4-hydroxy-tetrahydrodipicolinate synthase